MALHAKALIFVLHTFVWSFIGTFRVSHGTSSDISCLKSIKESLVDTYGYLNYTWNFNDNTEGFICKFTGVECWHPDENKVLNIRLHGMGLKGQFPQGIENCKSLRGLDLSHNKLWGPLPFDIGKRLKSVRSLDLNDNNFSGEIPLSFGDCSSLTVLILDNNQLMGHIPRQLGRLSRLKTFSVANNLLSGQVPEFVSANISPESYANNKGLCGPPLQPCKKHWLKFDYSFKSGFLVGYVVSVVSVITVFMSYCGTWVQVKKKSKIPMTPMMTDLMERRSKKTKEADKGGKLPSVKLLQKWSKEISILENSVKNKSLRDLTEATDNFSQHNVIGSGQMGTMYKGTLRNGLFVAVKRLEVSQHFDDQFTSELKTLSRLRHDNIVTLLGFCIESEERLLVYEYMSNGNLHDWLHPMEGKAKVMEWPLRVKIAIGLARGLAWLYHNCVFRIVHLNISSKCILLDHNLKPKLSNFGEAIMMDPNDTGSDSTRSLCVNSESWQLGFAKEDVHGFGIVLLELITGKDPSKMSSSSNVYSKTLNEWITHLSTSSSGFYNAVDKSLMGKGFDGEIFHLLKVACNCVQSSPDQRPTMLEVYNSIKAIGERYGVTNDSEISTQVEIATANWRDECTEDEITEIQ